jgi:hypothetical protein
MGKREEGVGDKFVGTDCPLLRNLMEFLGGVYCCMVLSANEKRYTYG